MFEFPNRNKLIDEQKRIIDDFESEHMLITGPPGSGKTVIALFISNTFNKNNSNNYIVYNNTLDNYIDYALSTQRELSKISKHITYFRWLKKYCVEYLGLSEIPEIKKFEPVWKKILGETIKLSDKITKYDELVIDEAQDLPPDFFHLISTITKHCYIFADQNQSLNSHNSKIDEIINKFNNKQLKVHQLYYNHRNTRQIYEFAKNFEVFDTEIKPPARTGDKPVLYHGTLEKQFDFVKRYILNNKSESIAILLSDIKSVKNFYIKLKSEPFIIERLDYYHYDKSNDCPKCIVGTIQEKKRRRDGHTFYACDQWEKGKNDCFTSNRFPKLKKIKFSSNAVIVLTPKSVKGLEFDTVFILNLSDKEFRYDNEASKMLFYVMSTRAKRNLFLMHEKDNFEFIDKIIKDNSLYIKKEL